MKQDDIKNNLLNSQQWLRILFMAGFAVAAWFILIGLIVLVLAQTVITLVAGEPNRNLQKVGYLFGAYLSEIVQYLVYNANTRPFPFADFPGAEGFVPPQPTTRPEPQPRQSQQQDGAGMTQAGGEGLGSAGPAPQDAGTQHGTVTQEEPGDREQGGQGQGAQEQNEDTRRDSNQP